MSKKNLLKSIFWYFFTCLLPIIIGGLIYLSFRDTSMLMFHWVDFISMGTDNI